VLNSIVFSYILVTCSYTLLDPVTASLPTQPTLTRTLSTTPDETVRYILPLRPRGGGDDDDDSGYDADEDGDNSADSDDDKFYGVEDDDDDDDRDAEKDDYYDESDEDSTAHL
jgi:hypothetical protein